jgi:predicted enzyme related to lactoylglutathione lyase
MGATASFKQHSRLKDFVNWFEIPVLDLQRAVRFYGTIYNMQLEVVYSGDFAMAYFPADKGVGGALVQGPGCHPSDIGVLIYLNAGGDLDSILARVELAGGRIIMPRTPIGGQAGHFALFLDSEGNRLALHEPPVVAPATKAVRSATGKAVKRVTTKKSASGRPKRGTR